MNKELKKNRNSFNYRINLIYRLIIFSFGIISSILMIVYNKKNNGYEYYFLVPLIFSFMYLICSRISSVMNRLGILVLNIVLIMKYIAMPLTSCLSNYYISRGFPPLIDDIRKSIFLTIYELIAVMLTANFFIPKFYKKGFIQSTYIRFKDINNKGIYLTMISISIIAIIINPGLRQEFIPYFFKSDLNEALYFEKSFGVLGMIVTFSRNIFVLLIIYCLKKSYDKKEKYIYPILSIFVVVLDLFFTSGMSRWTIIIPGLTYLVLLMIIFKKHRRTIIIIFGGAISISFFSMTMIKSFGNKDISNSITSEANLNWLAEYIRAYFIGPKSVALSYPVNEYFKSLNINSITIMFNDIFSSVPGISSLTTYEYSTPYVFNYFIYYNHIAKDAIVPLISQGYVYFGFIFAPILSCLSVIMMMWLEKKAVDDPTDIIKFYICTYVSLWFARGITLNITIIFSHFFNRFCLLYLIYLINKYIALKKF